MDESLIDETESLGDPGPTVILSRSPEPVNTKDASANAVIGAQSKARGAAKAISRGGTGNAALRPNGHVPEGLFPKRPCAAL